MRHGDFVDPRGPWARIAGPGAAVAFAVVCLGTAARARDILSLDDGQFLEGEVTEETDEAVWIMVGNTTMRIDRSRVIRIERDKPLPSWQALLRDRIKEDRERRAQAALAALEKAEAKATESKKDDEGTSRLVEDLGADDAERRKEAAALLEREGSKAVPALTKSLGHSSAFVRESSARILGKLGARQSVREMIIALRSSVPDKEKIRPWQRPFVRALCTSLSATTGQDFGISFYGTDQGKVAEEYVTWWDGEDPSGAKEGGAKPKRGACIEWDTPQVGEAQIAEDDPEREKKLWDARRIGGERRSYSPPKSFVDPLGDTSGRD